MKNISKNKSLIRKSLLFFLVYVAPTSHLTTRSQTSFVWINRKCGSKRRRSIYNGLWFHGIQVISICFTSVINSARGCKRLWLNLIVVCSFLEYNTYGLVMMDNIIGYCRKRVVIRWPSVAKLNWIAGMHFWIVRCIGIFLKKLD